MYQLCVWEEESESVLSDGKRHVYVCVCSVYIEGKREIVKGKTEKGERSDGRGKSRESERRDGRLTLSEEVAFRAQVDYFQKLNTIC